MTATEQDFTIYQNTSKTLQFAVTEGGSAKNLSGATATWVLFRRQNNKNITVLTKSGTITDAAGGIVQVALTAAETNALNGTFQHYLHIVDSATKADVVAIGQGKIISVGG